MGWQKVYEQDLLKKKFHIISAINRKSRNMTMTHHTIRLTSISLCLGLLLSGCMSYTTLQSPKTLESGQVILGGGIATSFDGGDASFEFNGRIGIVHNFDVGAKIVMPSLYFVDAKYQLFHDPIDISADLGWSSFSNSSQSSHDKGSTTAWYPMLLFGQDHWYVGVKQVILKSTGQFELFGTQKFSYSGLWSTNIVIGGIFGTNIRMMPEINFIMLNGGNKPVIVPAIGVQVVL
jgi:hypothetical protein